MLYLPIFHSHMRINVLRLLVFIHFMFSLLFVTAVLYSHVYTY